MAPSCEVDISVDPVQAPPLEQIEHKAAPARSVDPAQDAEEYRLPLMLRYLGDADYETISRQLALSNGSLRGLLRRGMQMLRENEYDS